MFYNLNVNDDRSSKGTWSLAVVDAIKFFLTALDRLTLFNFLLIGRSVNDRIESPQDPLITIINTDVFANALPRTLDDVKLYK